MKPLVYTRWVETTWFAIYGIDKVFSHMKFTSGIATRPITIILSFSMYGVIEMFTECLHVTMISVCSLSFNEADAW